MRWIVILILITSTSCKDNTKSHEPDSPVIRKSYVDSIRIHTAAGQLFELELWQDINSCYWVVGGDTIQDPYVTSTRLKEYKTKKYSDSGLFLDNYIFNDSDEVFMSPLTVYSDGNICAICELPDSLLMQYCWLVKPGIKAHKDLFSLITVQIHCAQLDEDKARERVAECRYSDDRPTAYIIYNDLENKWTAIDTFYCGRPGFHTRALLTDSLYPFFGLIYEGWGSGYLSKDLHLLRLYGDTVVPCAIINEWNSYYWYPYFSTDTSRGYETINVSTRIEGNSLKTKSKVFAYFMYEEDTSTHYFVNGQIIELNFTFNPKKRKFIPVVSENNKWLWDSGDGSFNFQLDSYAENHLRRLKRRYPVHKFSNQLIAQSPSFISSRNAFTRSSDLTISTLSNVSFFPFFSFSRAPCSV